MLELSSISTIRLYSKPYAAGSHFHEIFHVPLLVVNCAVFCVPLPVNVQCCSCGVGTGVSVGIDVSNVAVGTGVSVVPCALFVAASCALLVAATCAPLSLVLVVVVVVLPEFAIALAPTHAKMAMISRIAHIGKHPALR